MKSRILNFFKASNEIEIFLSTSKLRYCYSKITVFGFTDTKTSYAINKSTEIIKKKNTRKLILIRLILMFQKKKNGR